MTLEVRPFGVKCNLGCHYCYQEPQRDAGNIRHRYDLELMKRAIDSAGRPFSLFGGEPLLMPLDDLEELWSWGLERFGGNSVQTNGTLITEKHVELFRRYRVAVGISIDGPGELNDLRWHGSPERTRRATEKTEAAIRRLCDAGMRPALIVTLHRANASAERLPLLVAWFRELDALRIPMVTLHPLESENELIRRSYALTSEENVVAFLRIADLQPELEHIRFDTFGDLLALLRGTDQGAACVWHACDPYTTEAVQGIEGHGESSNCGRTNKDGIDFLKAGSEGFERYLALYHTPQEAGGCKDCRFFFACKGQCPGTAIDGDWRNRTEHCELWKELFGRLEQQMLVHGEEPVSLSPLLPDLEAELVRSWAGGRNSSVSEALAKVRR
jgi:uncharacterized protein